MPSPKGSTRSKAAAREVEVVPARPPYVSASMEVLETLEIQNTLSAIEARMDSLEIDVARAQGSRDDDMRRIAGEMAVMKARVEDALTAFAATADELRAMSKAVEQRLEGVAAGATAGADVHAVRAEMAAGIDGVMAGVGDVLEGLTGEIGSRIEELGGRMQVVQDAVLGIAGVVERLAQLPQRLDEIDARVRSLEPDA